MKLLRLLPDNYVLVATAFTSLTLAYDWLHADYAQSRDLAVLRATVQVDYRETRVDETLVFADDGPKRQEQLAVI